MAPPLSIQPKKEFLQTSHASSESVVLPIIIYVDAETPSAAEENKSDKPTTLEPQRESFERQKQTLQNELIISWEVYAKEHIAKQVEVANAFEEKERTADHNTGFFPLVTRKSLQVRYKSIQASKERE